jgi:NRAMP (natural resistance-associated macrophage protein)-like metal ion transporter
MGKGVLKAVNNVNNEIKKAVKGMDVAFHLAALIGIPFSYHSPDLYIDTNVKGTLNILQACRDHYSMPVIWFLWVICEIAIAACDLAEVLGGAIGLNLLSGVPLLWCVCIMAADVFVILFLQQRGMRWVEAIVVTLVVTNGFCYLVEIVLAHPDWGPLFAGFVFGTIERGRNEHVPDR